jgi:hypothetical protein
MGRDGWCLKKIIFCETGLTISRNWNTFTRGVEKMTPDGWPTMNDEMGGKDSNDATIIPPMNSFYFVTLLPLPQDS